MHSVSLKFLKNIENSTYFSFTFKKLLQNVAYIIHRKWHTITEIQIGETQEEIKLLFPFIKFETAAFVTLLTQKQLYFRYRKNNFYFIA